MKRWLSTLVLFAVCSAVVRADVTIVQTMTMEGGVVAMTGQNGQEKIDRVPRIYNGSAGLGSRDVRPGDIMAIVDNMVEDETMLVTQSALRDGQLKLSAGRKRHVLVRPS